MPEVKVTRPEFEAYWINRHRRQRRLDTLQRLLFGHGEDGFLFGNFGELDELFLLNTGATGNVAVNDDPVGLALDDHGWGGQTLAQVLAAATEMVTNGGLTVNAAGWTAVNSPVVTHGASGATIQNAGATYGILYQALTTIVGRTYRMSAEIDYTGPGFARVELQTGAPSLVGSTGINVAADGSFSAYFVATATTTNIVIGNRNDNNALSAFKNVSVKLVPGNHALQATTANRPLWKANAGKPYLAFDGSNDALTLNSAPQPTSAGTVAVAARLVVAGVGDTHAFSMGTATGNKRLRISFNSSGRAVFVFNDQATTVGDPLTDMDVVLVQTWGDGRRLCYIQGVAIVDEARVSNHDGTGLTPALGANEGATGGYLNGRISAALALNRRVTPAEIARITADFQSTF